MAGKHRKPSPLTITLRTTGSLIAGAAVVGTAAATAQAAVGAPGDTASPKPPTAASAVGKAAANAALLPAPKERAKAPKAQKKIPTAQDAIELAESQVGIQENGDGQTKFQDWYMTTERARQTVDRDGGSIKGYDDAQWCSMFISWIGDRLGFGDQVGSDAWTVAHAEWFERQGRWGTTPKPGAVVFFDWNGGKKIDDITHVGMVIKDNGDGTVRTVEGNTGDAVKVRERSADQIVGYGYPEYAK